MIAQFNGFDARGMYLQRMILDGRYKYIFNPGDFDELYDLETDPHEMRNVIAEPALAETSHTLRAALAEQMKASGDPFAHKIDDFLGL